jgi:tetratricopeptide (TPR) repeat protein
VWLLVLAKTKGKAMLKNTSVFFILLFSAAILHANTFPESFCTFRETVYAQNTNLLELMRLYTQAKEDIERTFTGVDLYTCLSRCEYLMGLSFQIEGKKNEAAAFYEQGIAWAEESLTWRPTSEGYRLLGTNISLLCGARRSYALSHFSRIEENANKAIDLDPQNLTAYYLIAAKYVVAPWPFGNVRKGASLLEEIIRQNIEVMEQEDRFNLYLMLELACIKLKRNADAQIWHEKASALYPTNNFINVLLK